MPCSVPSNGGQRRCRRWFAALPRRAVAEVPAFACSGSLMCRYHHLDVTDQCSRCASPWESRATATPRVINASTVTMQCASEYGKKEELLVGRATTSDRRLPGRRDYTVPGQCSPTAGELGDKSKSEWPRGGVEGKVIDRGKHMQEVMELKGGSGVAAYDYSSGTSRLDQSGGTTARSTPWSVQ
eukprot:4131147-Lingulodinium_polyedra.AAC.1